ncbi:MAG: hypothetical protein WCJ30_05485, partial [Deltaproteobacteria bacterium]
LSLAATVLMLATHVLFFGGDRYHLPLAPFVAVLAAGALRDLPGVTWGRKRYTVASVALAEGSQEERKTRSGVVRRSKRGEQDE